MKTFTTSDQVKLAYKLEGEGKPLVLVHGWSGNMDNFTPQLEELKKSYQVLSYDHRGHGFSQRPLYGLSLKRLAQDLEELMDHLGLEEVLLAGWSMGAMTLFDYVRQFGTGRLKACLIIDMTPKLINDDSWHLGLYDGSYREEDNKKDLSQMFENFLVFSGEFMKKALPYLTDELMEAMAKEQQASGIPPADLLALTGLWHAMGAADYREDLSKIDVPTRIFRGKLTSLYSKETADYIADRIMGTRIVEFEGASHMLVVEQASRVSQEILDFAQEVYG